MGIFRIILMGMIAWLVCFPSAFAMDITNSATFQNTGALNASVLQATVAASTVNFQPAANTIVEGNRLENVAGGGFGVICIVQNTGNNSNVHQAITFMIGTLNINNQQ